MTDKILQYVSVFLAICIIVLVFGTIVPICRSHDINLFGKILLSFLFGCMGCVGSVIFYKDLLKNDN